MAEVTLDALLNKRILVGITYYTKDDEIIERVQFWGTVIRADERTIEIALPNGEIKTLPPDLRSTSAAPPGEYRLRTTGEIVENPDYLSVWNVNRE